MKHLILFCLLLTLTSMQLFSQGDVSKSRWISSPVTIDGNDTEWRKPLNFFDNASGIMYAISNDKDNLYLCFTVNDEMRMKKLMSAGWTIKLSSKEKKKKFKSEIKFPGVNVMGIKMNKNKIEKASDNVIQFYQLQMTKVSCKGLKCNISELALNDREHITIGIGADNTQHIVYEIAVPLKEFFASDLKNLHELITMNIIVNGLERPSGGGSGGRPSGMGGSYGGGRSGGGSRGGGGGGRGGGGMSGGMRGEGSRGEYSQGEQGDRGSMFERTSFKQKFTLSGNSN